MAIHNEIQSSCFDRCIDRLSHFVQNRSPIAQVLAGGSAMLVLNTAVVTTAKFIPDPVFKSVAIIIPPILTSIGIDQIGKSRGLQLENTALAAGYVTGLVRPIAEGVGLAIGMQSPKGNPSNLLKAVFSALWGTRAAKILQQYPEPRNCVKTALTIAGFITADMLMGGNSLIVACASGAFAAASTLLASRFPLLQR